MSPRPSCSAKSGGVSFLGLLALVFITLRLVGVIEWSWWLILLPLYGPLAVLVALLLVFILAASLAALGEAAIDFAKSKRRKAAA